MLQDEATTYTLVANCNTIYIIQYCDSSYVKNHNLMTTYDVIREKKKIPMGLYTVDRE